MSKPYILLATGSFAMASLYDDFVARVKARGYDMRALQLATVGLAPGKGRDTPPATLYDDAALIAKEVEILADAGREVVLVAHSYGGMPATESTKGLTVKERQKQGKKGGIVRLAYMTVILTSPGYNSVDCLPPSDDGPMTLPDEDGWFHFVDPEHSASKTFSDLSKEDGLRWQSQFALHSAVSFTNTLTHPGYKDVPVSYLLCEEDVVISAETQRKEIEMIEQETGTKVDVTSIQAGHVPLCSVPEMVVDWILQAVHA
ncbi:Alpha/beta hydrolase fold-1 [Astrocystis sublimbata]|nr:Alpha/beta hydrolase fold-1 [Astrocystis sublimbata]